MMTRKELEADAKERQSRACGSLIGLAIGDSFGDACRLQDNRVNYGFTTDFNKGASWSTDDTEFALLTARTLIKTKGVYTSKAVVEAWMENVVVQDELQRGGQSEIFAANNLRKGLLPPESGMYNTFHMSDGTAMRIPPVGIVCAGDPQRAAEIARIDAEISHFRDGIWGAQAVAAAVSVAMVDASWEDIFDTAMHYIPSDSWLYHEMREAFRIVDDAHGNVLDAWMPLHDELKTSAWATTAEAIPAAFACLRLEHSEFRKAMVLAGNYGRDADTIGAVCGALLGAKYGLGAIPERWIEKTRYPSGTCLQFTKGLDILEVAAELATLI